MLIPGALSEMTGKYSPTASLISVYLSVPVLFYANWKAGVILSLIFILFFILHRRAIKRASSYIPPEGSLSRRYRAGGHIIPSPAFEEWLQVTYAEFKQSHPDWSDRSCWISTIVKAESIMRKNHSIICYGSIILSCILAWLFPGAYKIIDGDIVSQGMLWQGMPWHRWILWRPYE